MSREIEESPFLRGPFGRQEKGSSLSVNVTMTVAALLPAPLLHGQQDLLHWNVQQKRQHRAVNHSAYNQIHIDGQ